MTLAGAHPYIYTGTDRQTQTNTHTQNKRTDTHTHTHTNAHTKQTHTQNKHRHTQIIVCSFLTDASHVFKLVHLATESLFSVHSLGDLFLENPKQNINSI